MQNELIGRLADLIAKAKRNKNGREFSCEQERYFFLAEELVENGVIVPPCNVGDMCYIRTTFSIIERKVVGFKYSLDMKNLEGIFIDLVNREGKTTTKYFIADRINDCIFFTRGEAEKALKEGADNG